MAFRRVQIVQSRTLGDQFAEARAQRGINLDQAARETHIAFKYLEALERNDIGALPGEGYVRQFTKQYAAYVGLDPSRAWRLAQELIQQHQRRYFYIEQQQARPWPRIMRRAVVIGLMLAVVAFLSYRVERIFVPPPLVVSEPADGSSLVEPQIRVSGSSEPEAEIIINNNPVLVDTAGRFTTLIDLQKGLNLIKITAKKRYSRERTQEIRVLFRDSQ